MTENLMHTYEIVEAANGQWYWRLVAANGETLSTSELYTTKDHAERGAVGAGANTDQLKHVPRS